MNPVARAVAWIGAVLLIVALTAYGGGYYFCIHRHCWSITAGVDFVDVDENTYAFFRPAVWTYERSTGRQVILNPLVHPAP